MVDPSLPTVLVYGHYDVQPVDPIGLWHSDPFEPQIRDGAIYARGANDDKGQLYMHIKAFEFMVREGKLKHNVKFILEGEEEIGSPSLAAVCATLEELHGFKRKRCLEILNAVDKRILYTLNSQEAIDEVYERIGLKLNFKEPFDRVQEAEE